MIRIFSESWKNTRLSGYWKAHFEWKNIPSQNRDYLRITRMRNAKERINRRNFHVFRWILQFYGEWEKNSEKEMRGKKIREGGVTLVDRVFQIRYIRWHELKFSSFFFFQRSSSTRLAFSMRILTMLLVIVFLFTLMEKIF